MSEKLKVVLVGCGGISNAWFGPSKEFDDIEYVGLVDINLENAKKRQEEHGFTDAVVGTDLKEVLAKTNPDAVFDCTVPCAHCDVTVTSLEHGCHVLGEKPMAESMADARKMVNTAKEKGKIYSVIQNRRYKNQIILYRDLVQNSQMGQLTTLNADFYIGAHFGGFRDEMDHVLLVDMSIHSFDQARFISGKDPVSVYCHEWNPAGSWYHHGASAMCIFEMSDGTVFNYRGSWCAEGMNTSWECDWRAICENGSILWDGGDDIRGEVVDGDEGFFRPKVDLEKPAMEDIEFSGHAGVIRDFIDCVKDGGEPQTICTDNIKSLAMVHAAVESAESGKKVEISY